MDEQGKEVPPTSMDKAEVAANILTAHINGQFQLSAEVAAIDLNTVAAMNGSAKTFYAGMNERLCELVNAAEKVQEHATDASKFASDMAALLQKARRLEALVDRLDEYTSRQEAALSQKRN